MVPAFDVPPEPIPRKHSLSLFSDIFVRVGMSHLAMRAPSRLWILVFLNTATAHCPQPGCLCIFGIFRCACCTHFLCCVGKCRWHRHLRVDGACRFFNQQCFVKASRATHAWIVLFDREPWTFEEVLLQRPEIHKQSTCVGHPNIVPEQCHWQCTSSTCRLKIVRGLKEKSYLLEVFLNGWWKEPKKRFVCCSPNYYLRR